MTVTSPKHSVADDGLDAQIALLKSLRTQTLELVVDSRGVDNQLSFEFGKVRDLISERLAYALLRRELECPTNNDLVLERLPSGEHAWLRREEQD